MVSLEVIRSSNRRLDSLPANLVAVFVGATSGIGETAMKQFVKHANAPKVYFVGRTTTWADRIKKELQILNAKGTYIFLRCDASLLNSVDEVCKELSDREDSINLLFLSIGTLITGTCKTSCLYNTSYATVHQANRIPQQLQKACITLLL